MINLKDNTLLREIPNNLLVDERVSNFAKAIQSSLDKMLEWSNKINYTMQLENLDDEILDYLLWEKHITWPEGLSLINTREQKIKFIQNAITLHRIKGTPAALELVFSIVDVTCSIKEWFEYEGDPYHFKINLSVLENGVSEETMTALEALVMEYKNVRSYLESINIFLTSRASCYVGASIQTGEEITIYPWTVSNIQISGIHYLSAGQTGVDSTVIYPQGGVVNE